MIKQKTPAQKPKNFKRAWGKLLRFCRPHRAAIWIALTFVVASTVIRVIGPTILSDIAEYAFYMFAIRGYTPVSGIMADIVGLSILLVVLYAIMFVLQYIQQFIMATVSQRISKRMRKDISGKINKLPLQYYDKRSTGDILSRITNDTDTLAQSLNNSIINLIAAVVLLLGSMIMMFTLNWIMAITAVVTSIIGFFAMGLIVGRTQKHFVNLQKQLGTINSHVEEYYGAYNVVRVSNAGSQVNKVFEKYSYDLYQSAWKSQFYSGLMQPIMGFVSNISYVGIVLVGGYLLFSGYVGVGIIAAFLIYVRLFTEPLSTIASAATSLQSTAAASERVFEFLDQPNMPCEDHIFKKLNKVYGNIDFENVQFGYRKNKIVINGFSANIKQGSKVAIVGPTGAGKTTMVNLLMRFYDVNAGDIKIDGTSIAELKRQNIHDLFAMVLQETWLFEGTVRENIVYNMPGITDEQLHDACASIGVDHFIRTLPHGYDTIIDEQSKISEGQRQLITIARAMLKNAPLLILDEATSSVDTRTEAIIQEAMDKLTSGRTSFVIAHRLSTIKNADVILVMRGGDIVEQGTHRELLDKNGFYAELYNSQFATQ